MKDLSHYRKSYEKSALLEQDIPNDPINLFHRWFHEVQDFGGTDEVNAMTVSTQGLDGFPKARVVLLKQYNEQGLTCYCTLHQPFASSACFQVSRNESAASSRQNCKAIEEEEKTCLKSFNFFSCGLALWLGTFVALPLCTILQKNIGQSSKTNQTVRVHLPLAFFSSTSCPQLL